MESSRLKTEITQRNELLYKIDAETQMVEKVGLLCSFYSFKRKESLFFIKGSNFKITALNKKNTEEFVMNHKEYKGG